MTDAAPIISPAEASEDRTAPAVAYGLYLLGLATGITPLIGLIVAYVNRDRAGPVARSHYTFLIYTFWLTLAWCLIAGVLLLVGIPLSLVLIGIPFALLGGAIAALVGVWFVVRCILGVIYLARGEAYPRPRNWLF